MRHDASSRCVRVALACGLLAGSLLALAGCSAPRAARVQATPQRPLFAVVRSYTIEGREELAPKVAASFVPQLRQQPGFVSYTIIWTGSDRWTAVSVFETQAQAEASTRLAAQWGHEHAPKQVGEPVVYEGPAVIHVAR